MVRLSLLSVAWLAATAASAASPPNDTPVDQAPEIDLTEVSILQGAFIIECETPQVVDTLAQDVKDRGGTVRQTFRSVIYTGLSVQIPDTNGTNTEGDDFQKEMEGREGVKAVWPVTKTQIPLDKGDLSANPQGNMEQLRDVVARDLINSPFHHVLTQVDKLQAEGFTGSGIKIGVVDSGVNYSIPALGGCFGPGCRVEVGAAFGFGFHEDDPMDYMGHGTSVASILAGYSKEEGFVGVAPNATIGAYRVISDAEHVDDILMAAWVRAFEDGMQIIVSSAGVPSNNSPRSPLVAIIWRIAERGIPCIIAAPNRPDSPYLFSVDCPSCGRGVLAVGAAEASGHVADFSPIGPALDLTVKPNLIAPGRDIPIPRNGTKVMDTGTSFAAPLVAGIVALIAEARGSFEPALMESLLMSTAAPQDRVPSSVGRQGGGLIQAWDAAHAKTIIQPASLAFNDTDHRVPSLSLNITNTASTELHYELSSIPAQQLSEYARIPFYIPAASDAPGVPGTAPEVTIKLSQSSFVLGPGQTVSVHVSASDPTGIDLDRLHLWSGYIKIQEGGPANKSLTVPYLGMAGSLRSQNIFRMSSLLWTIGTFLAAGKSQGGYVESGQPFIFPNPPSTNLAWDSAGMRINQPGRVVKGSVCPAFSILAGTGRLEIYVIPVDICGKTAAAEQVQSCVPETMVNKIGNLETMGQISGPGSRGYIPSGFHPEFFSWTGRLASGQYAPPGRYRLAVRALRLLGDADVAEHWQTEETIEFSILYEANLITS